MMAHGGAEKRSSMQEAKISNAGAGVFCHLIGRFKVKSVVIVALHDATFVTVAKARVE
jgi:hypothetical protein